MPSVSSDAMQARRLRELRDARRQFALAQGAAARERERVALGALWEAQRRQRILKDTLPELHGATCDVHGLRQRLRLLGVARASLLEVGMRMVTQEREAAEHAKAAQVAQARSETHRRAAERMAIMAQALRSQSRRFAEERIEEESQEIFQWQLP